jgi:alkylation response protein AidB-like acyl-CoA dehydrogenase
MEELARVGATSVNVAWAGTEDLVGPYLVDLATEEQKARWLPGLYAGETTAAIAMTEPGAGSDLRGMRTTARRTDDGWVLDGSKTFITGGTHADLVIVAARTPASDAPGDRDRRRDPVTLFVVESGMPGFTRGAPFDTVGQRADAPTDLFFDGVAVPHGNVLGIVDKGFAHLMERLPVERMSIACFAQALAEQALRWTLEFVRERTAFGQRVADFQATRFALAEMDTELAVTRAYVDACVRALDAGTLSADDGARAKWWTTELLQRVVGRCVQLHGGYGYVREYPIARLFADVRVHTIYGGTTEILKDVIGRSLVAPRS